MTTFHADPAKAAIGVAKDSADLILQSADWAEKNGRQHPDVVQHLADNGIHRMSVPTELAGLGLSLADTFKVLETVASVDGSAAWCLMVSSETLGPVVGDLPADTAQSLLEEQPAITVAGSASPIGTAHQVSGGYVVDGHWPFGSGVHNASYWIGGCKVDNATPEGPRYIQAVIPRDAVKVIDGTWDVTGLAGTGSVEVETHDRFVPNTHIAINNRPSRLDTALYRVPLPLRWAYPKTAVAIGIAGAAVEAFIALANEKTPKGERSTLAERPRAQIAVAEATADVQQGRAWCLEMLETVWHLACEGDPVSSTTYASVRLSCSMAIQRAVHAVDLVHGAAGATPNFKNAPLNRAWRDIHAIPGQIQAAPHMIEAAGRALLGNDPAQAIY